jgi:hypothetical protein
MTYMLRRAQHVRQATPVAGTHAVLPRLSACNRPWAPGTPRQRVRTVKTALGEPRGRVQHQLSSTLLYQACSQAALPSAADAPVTAPSVPPTTTTTLPKVPAAEQQDSSSTDKFDWFAAWYPVAALDTLKPDRPTQVQLLGQDFVVWRDSAGEWQAFEDTCPHRWVPGVLLGRACGPAPCNPCTAHCGVMVCLLCWWFPGCHTPAGWPPCQMYMLMLSI